MSESLGEVHTPVRQSCTGLGETINLVRRDEKYVPPSRGRVHLLKLRSSLERENTVPRGASKL